LAITSSDVLARTTKPDQKATKEVQILIDNNRKCTQVSKSNSNFGMAIISRRKITRSIKKNRNKAMKKQNTYGGKSIRSRKWKISAKLRYTAYLRLITTAR